MNVFFVLTPLPVWRNGRRTRLKILRWQHRVGSTPTTGTTRKHEFNACVFLFQKSTNAIITWLSRFPTANKFLWEPYNFFATTSFLFFNWQFLGRRPAPSRQKLQIFVVHLLKQLISVFLTCHPPDHSQNRTSCSVFLT